MPASGSKNKLHKIARLAYLRFIPFCDITLTVLHVITTCNVASLPSTMGFWAVCKQTQVNNITIRRCSRSLESTVRVGPEVGSRASAAADWLCLFDTFSFTFAQFTRLRKWSRVAGKRPLSPLRKRNHFPFRRLPPGLHLTPPGPLPLTRHSSPIFSEEEANVLRNTPLSCEVAPARHSERTCLYTEPYMFPRNVNPGDNPGTPAFIVCLFLFCLFSKIFLHITENLLLSSILSYELNNLHYVDDKQWLLNIEFWQISFIIIVIPLIFLSIYRRRKWGETNGIFRNKNIVNLISEFIMRH